MQDTAEQAISDSLLTNFDYTADQFRRYFTSPFDQYKDRVGQEFSVIGRNTDAEADLDDFEDMYRIRFHSDGAVITAWGHEVCQLVYDNCA